jgi:hypothetical protein
LWMDSITSLVEWIIPTSFISFLSPFDSLATDGETL